MADFCAKECGIWLDGIENDNVIFLSAKYLKCCCIIQKRVTIKSSPFAHDVNHGVRLLRPLNL